jgi:hypothetical protein
MEKNIAWFKNHLAPRLKEYNIEYRFFEEGDFGSLNQVVFNNEKKEETSTFGVRGG